LYPSLEAMSREKRARMGYNPAIILFKYKSTCCTRAKLTLLRIFRL
jgi:hypothetical protein